MKFLLLLLLTLQLQAEVWGINELGSNNSPYSKEEAKRYAKPIQPHTDRRFSQEVRDSAERRLQHRELVDAIKQNKNTSWR